MHSLEAWPSLSCQLIDLTRLTPYLPRRPQLLYAPGGTQLGPVHAAPCLLHARSGAQAGARGRARNLWAPQRRHPLAHRVALFACSKRDPEAYYVQHCTAGSVVLTMDLASTCSPEDLLTAASAHTLPSRKSGSRQEPLDCLGRELTNRLFASPRADAQPRTHGWMVSKKTRRTCQIGSALRARALAAAKW